MLFSNETPFYKFEKALFPVFDTLVASNERLASLSQGSSMDPSLLKQIMNIWFHLSFFQKDFEGPMKHQVKIFGFYSPNLVELSNKGFSNQIITNELASNQKLADNYQRKFKHLLREQYPEQRP